MKKVITIMSLVLTAFIGFSQTGKGSWMIGGSFDFGSSKQKIFGLETKTSRVDFSPTVGYFIAPNLAVGINAGISSVTEKSQGSSDEKATFFTAGPFARYYLGVGSKTKLLAGAAALFGSTKGLLDYSRHNITAFQLEAGPAIFITESVALEFLVNYVNQNFKGNESFYDADANEFGFSVGLQFYLKKKSGKG